MIQASNNKPDTRFVHFSLTIASHSKVMEFFMKIKHSTGVNQRQWVYHNCNDTDWAPFVRNDSERSAIKKTSGVYRGAARLSGHLNKPLPPTHCHFPQFSTISRLTLSFVARNDEELFQFNFALSRIEKNTERTTHINWWFFFRWKLPNAHRHCPRDNEGIRWRRLPGVAEWICARCHLIQ